MSTFSDEQQLCFEKYLKGENLFITGPGGTCKSFLIKNIVKEAESNKKIIISSYPLVSSVSSKSANLEHFSSITSLFSSSFLKLKKDVSSLNNQ